MSISTDTLAPGAPTLESAFDDAGRPRAIELEARHPEASQVEARLVKASQRDAIQPGSAISTTSRNHDAAQSLDRERARRISAVIRFAEKRLRRRFPVLNCQNLLGTLIFLGAAGTMIGSGALYLTGAIPAWLCIVISAIAASILHELEHDLIHNLYFRTAPVLQNLMMLSVWALRGNIISPWLRRKLHLLHHKVSGQEVDLEERLIGNGMRYGFLRLITTFDGFLSTVLRGHEFAGVPAFNQVQLALATLPFMLLFTLAWYAFVLFHVVSGAAGLFGAEVGWPAWVLSTMPVLNAAAVVYLIPNILRQASINIVSSSMHYFGDVEGVTDQTQVFNAWYLWPLQIFCFNFGSTHGIHHFVVSQPFYLRQMVARPAHAAMRKYGVRFNDFGTFRRANRLH